MTSENPDRRSASPGSVLRSLTPRLPTIGEEIIDAGKLSRTDILNEKSMCGQIRIRNDISSDIVKLYFTYAVYCYQQ